MIKVKVAKKNKQKEGRGAMGQNQIRGVCPVCRKLHPVVFLGITGGDLDEILWSESEGREMPEQEEDFILASHPRKSGRLCSGSRKTPVWLYFNFESPDLGEGEEVHAF